MQRFRISAQQRRLSILGGNSACRSWTLLEWPNGLEPQRLQAALNRVVGRHQILRTSFEQAVGMQVAVQVVNDDRRIVIHQTDRNIEQWIADQARLRTSLIEASLLKDSRSLVGLSLPGLCADWWTLGLLADELVHFYEAPSGDFEEPLQYAQFVEWQNELLEGDEGRAYLSQVDVSEAGKLVLPHERVYRGFEPERKHVADAKASRELLLACWQALLWRHTKASPLRIAEWVDARKYAELAGMFGPCAKWMPVRRQFEQDLTMDELVERTRKAGEQAKEWEEYFFWPEEGGIPIGFRYQKWPCQESSVARCVAQWACGEPYRLQLSCLEKGEVVEVGLEYAKGSFSASSIDRLAEEFGAMLGDAVERSQALVGELSTVGPRERRLLIEEWSGMDAAPEMGCVHQRIEAEAALRPDRVALAEQDEWLTYGELNRRANQIGRRLKEAGAGPESVIAVCLQRSVRQIVALVGAWKAGAAYLPLEPEQPRERLGRLLRESGAALAVTEEKWRQKLGGACGLLSLDGEWESIERRSGENLETEVEGSNLAYVIYTSGSTGEPKGVCIEHRQLSHYVAQVAERLGLEAGARYALVSTVAADLGNTVMFPSLCQGGTLHVIEEERARDGAALGEYMASRQIDCVKIVPTHLKGLRESGGGSKVIPERLLICGGDVLGRELAQAAMAEKSHCRVMNHYGPSETTVGVLTHETAPTGMGDVPLGRPLGNVRIYVLDERMELCAAGQQGELYIGGTTVGRGYLGKADPTAERFVPDPFGRGSRLYRTGDRVRWSEEGEIEFFGRLDAQVKIRGYRIEPGEIEAAMRRQTGVGDAVAVVRGSDEAKRVVGYWVRAKGSTIAVGELQERIWKELPEYMRPAALVELEQIPLTRNGKVDRARLPDEQEQIADSYVAPRTPVEEVLAGIWADVLRARRVGVHDNFFQLGGHSLLATRLMSRVGEAFRITIPLRRLFKNPTVAGLAEALVEGWQDASLVEQIALLHLGAANDDALSLAATAPPD